jgi:hypothetical protein
MFPWKLLENYLIINIIEIHMTNQYGDPHNSADSKREIIFVMHPLKHFMFYEAAIDSNNCTVSCMRISNMNTSSLSKI